MLENVLEVRSGLFRVRYRETDTSGRPIVFLHGWRGEEPDAFIEELGQEGRVVAPCQPGFGRSTGDDHLRDFGDLLIYHLDLLDALGIHEPFVLGGHSLGAMIAAEIAALQPDRVSHLALLSPFGLWNESYPVLDIFAASPESLDSACHSRPPVAVTSATPADPSASPSVSQALDRVKASRTAAKYLWPIPNRGLSKRLHRLRMPTLLLWGSRDSVCSPRYAFDYKSGAPHAEERTLEDLGHLPQYDDPRAVVAALGEFLRRTPDAPSTASSSIVETS